MAEALRIILIFLEFSFVFDLKSISVVFSDLGIGWERTSRYSLILRSVIPNCFHLARNLREGILSARARQMTKWAQSSSPSSKSDFRWGFFWILDTFLVPWCNLVLVTLLGPTGRWERVAPNLRRIRNLCSFQSDEITRATDKQASAKRAPFIVVLLKARVRASSLRL